MQAVVHSGTGHQPPALQRSARLDRSPRNSRKAAGSSTWSWCLAEEIGDIGMCGRGRERELVGDLLLDALGEEHADETRLVARPGFASGPARLRSRSRKARYEQAR